MKKLLMAALAITCAVNAPAQKDETRAVVEELLGLMNFQSNIEKSFAMVKQMQAQQLSKMDLKPEQAEKAMTQQDRMMDLLTRELTWDKLKDGYIDLYTEVFTMEELVGLRDFYKSDIGQKFIEKQPVVMQKSMELSQRQMAEILPKIQALARESAGEATQEAEEAGVDVPSMKLSPSAP